MDAREEVRDPKTAGCELVAMAARDAFDDSVQTEAAEVVGSFVPEGSWLDRV